VSRDIRRRLKNIEAMRKPATTMVLRFDDYDDLERQRNALPPHVKLYVALPTKMTEEEWIAAYAHGDQLERDRETYARLHGHDYSTDPRGGTPDGQ
jgi:hypothetical protein